MTSLDYTYTPDVVYPPGDTLRELLDARGMTQKELSNRLDMSEKTVSQLLNGKAPLSQDTALKLERVLGVAASFWNNLEARYREWCTKKQEEEELAKHRAFVDKFPLDDMVEREWVPACSSVVEKLRAILDFFGVANPTAWESQWGDGQLAAFRKTNARSVSKHCVATWLRAGERMAAEMVSEEYDKRRFEEALEQIRAMIPEPPTDFGERMVELCADAGVALVLMPQLEQTGISGATRWIHKTPIIQLSLRYRWEDFFWFALFHEAAHVLLHGKTAVFLEGEDSRELDDREDEANRWAADFLIPREKWEAFVRQRNEFYANQIVRFAREVGTSPGVVVGRLQHEERMDYKFNNDLRRKFDWVER